MKIAVVGGGLMGRLMAWRLSHASSGCQVELFDKGMASGTGSTGYIAAAMVAPVAESVIAGPLVTQLGFRTLQLWPALLADLELPVFYQQAGSLILAHAQDRGDLLSFQQRLKNSNALKTLNARQIAELEPELGYRFNQGLYIENEAQIDNRKLYQALLEALQQNAVKMHWQKPVVVEGNTIVCGTQTMQYDWVIDCRGMGAKADMQNTRERQLRGVRGEVARVYAPEVNISRPIRLMHPRYPIYIVPKPDKQYVIGATEIESESEKPVTVRSSMELLSAAYSVHSGFAEAHIEALDSGLRPTMTDNDPCIQVEQGLMRINGLYRHGFLLAPAILEQALIRLFQDSAKTIADSTLGSINFQNATQCEALFFS
ncbi:glycine oxidase ThiO [Catenovulum sediminis]|uniref:D-amino-acid oxidase n=1 Tax=Catenovulum sediminis TaxID=1740262 RepID=A0ABV1RET0_9ALTE